MEENNNFRFKNRKSEFPNRKKITILKQNANEIIADIEADEGTVEEAGTALDAQLFEEFYKEIDNAVQTSESAEQTANGAKEFAEYAKGRVDYLDDKIAQTKGTVVLINNEKQSDVNFSSDPQMQLDRSWKLAGKIEIPANSDLNDFKTVGNYGVGSYSNISTIANKPSGLTSVFTMKVYTATGSESGSYPMQEITTFDSQKFIRRFNTDSSAWSDWSEFITNNHTQNLSNKTFKNMTRFEGKNGDWHTPSVNMYVSGANAVALGDSPNHNQTIKLGTVNRETCDWSNLGTANFEVENEIYFKGGKRPVEKFQYQYNQSGSVGENPKYIKIAKFADVGDSGVIIDIMNTTSIARSARVIFANQNGHTHEFRIHGDFDDNIKNKLYIKPADVEKADRQLFVYYKPEAWEKWFISVSAQGCVPVGEIEENVDLPSFEFRHGFPQIMDSSEDLIAKLNGSKHLSFFDLLVKSGQAKEIFDGKQYGGNIKLKDNHTLSEFDLVAVYGASDDNNGGILQVTPLWKVNYAKANPALANNFDLLQGSIYWDITLASLFSNTLVKATENSVIYKIWGIKL